MLTGWAEKKISFLDRIAPQTMAARIQMPPCATAAVPGVGVSRNRGQYVQTRTYP